MLEKVSNQLMLKKLFNQLMLQNIIKEKKNWTFRKKNKKNIQCYQSPCIEHIFKL